MRSVIAWVLKLKQTAETQRPLGCLRVSVPAVRVIRLALCAYPLGEVGARSRRNAHREIPRIAKMTPHATNSRKVYRTPLQNALPKLPKLTWTDGVRGLPGVVEPVPADGWAVVVVCGVAAGGWTMRTVGVATIAPVVGMGKAVDSLDGVGEGGGVGVP